MEIIELVGTDLVDIDKVKSGLRNEALSDKERASLICSLARGCERTENVYDRIESVRDVLNNLTWELKSSPRSRTLTVYGSITVYYCILGDICGPDYITFLDENVPRMVPT